MDVSGGFELDIPGATAPIATATTSFGSTMDAAFSSSSLFSVPVAATPGFEQFASSLPTTSQNVNTPFDGSSASTDATLGQLLGGGSQLGSASFALGAQLDALNELKKLTALYGGDAKLLNDDLFAGITTPCSLPAAASSKRQPRRPARASGAVDATNSLAAAFSRPAAKPRGVKKDTAAPHFGQEKKAAAAAAAPAPVHEEKRKSTSLTSAQLKKQKRRDSHNAVERRRRDNINDRIIEIGTMIPAEFGDKNNKGETLTTALSYIRYLQGEQAALGKRLKTANKEVARMRTALSQKGGVCLPAGCQMPDMLPMSVPSLTPPQ